MNSRKPGPRPPATRRDSAQPAKRGPAFGRGASRRSATWLLLPALLLAVAAVYTPAWNGGMLWDDDGHITPQGLRSWSGLQRIWFDLGATQQYYPVVHSLFWLEHRIWGDAMPGYHLVNIFLHALAAFLVVLALRRLKVPGAVAAGVIFALHPVQVESVAWVAELKNTLSGVFYLGAALLYLDFDESRRRRLYAGALALFALALLSKTVTATLPAALLVVFWWRRGRLEWRRDIRPLLPFYALGAAGGLFTAYVERTLIGARGAEFQFTLIERFLIAGRAVCFYLEKLAWPANLVFNYPRWQVSRSAAWQYLYPLAVLALLSGLWILRKRFRAPLAASLLFIGTLFPALGFVNVYPFQFSFVADHFQYLACVAPIALFTALAAHAARKWRNRPGAAAAISVLLLGGLLGALTWRQSRQYADAETLYRATLARNPSSWMAYNNLGILRAASDPKEAVAGFEAALRIKPENPEIHNNLGSVLRTLGRFDEARARLEEAVRLDPAYFAARYNLGLTLQQLGLPQALEELEAAARLNPASAEARFALGNGLKAQGRLAEAGEQYQRALELRPDYADAHYNLGMILLALGRSGAEDRFRLAVELKPDFAEARNNLGNALQAAGRLAEAEAQLREALRLSPGMSDAHYNLGNVLQKMGRGGEAVQEYREALRLKPEFAEAHNSLGFSLLGEGRFAEAMACFREAARLKPDYADACFNLGNILLEMGRLAEAVPQYRQALKFRPDDADIHNNLGAALEGLGRFADSVFQYREALRLNPASAQARANIDRVTARQPKRKTN